MARKVLVLIVLVALLSSVSVTKALGECPAWLVENVVGKCVTSVTSENVSGLPEYDQSIYDWSPDRSLYVFTFRSIKIPEFNFLLGSNFNKWSLQPAWVYSDERMMNGLYFKTLMIGARLVCDANGSKFPTLTISIPKSELVWGWPNNIYFTVVNYEIINHPCGF